MTQEKTLLYPGELMVGDVFMKPWEPVSKDSTTSVFYKMVTLVGTKSPKYPMIVAVECDKDGNTTEEQNQNEIRMKVNKKVELIKPSEGSKRFQIAGSQNNKNIPTDPISTRPSVDPISTRPSVDPISTKSSVDPASTKPSTAPVLIKYIAVPDLKIGDIFQYAASPTNNSQHNTEMKYYRVLNITGAKNNKTHENTINAVECTAIGLLKTTFEKTLSYDANKEDEYRSDAYKETPTLRHQDISLQKGFKLRVLDAK